MNTSNLTKRLAFAAVAVPVGWVLVSFPLSLIPGHAARDFFGTDNVPLYAGQLLAVTVVFLACAEYINMLALMFPRNGFWLVYVWLTAECAGHLLPASALGVIDAFGAYDKYLLLLLVAAEAAIWGRKSSRWKRASLLFSGMVFLAYASYSLVNFYRVPLQLVFPPLDNPIVAQMGIMTVLASIFLCDTAAYFIGSLWGKHHFSSISPNKTIEGAVAGLVAATITGGVGWHFFAAPSLHPALGYSLGFLIGLSGQAGDLLVSLMKRYFHVKDASHLLPGHGGVLDRFDSLFFSAPIVHLFMIAVGKFM